MIKLTNSNWVTWKPRMEDILYCKDGLSVAEHLNNFQNIINQLATMKMTIEDELQALLLLGSLPDSWETFVVSISNSASNGVLTLDNVKNSMLNEIGRASCRERV